MPAPAPFPHDAPGENGTPGELDLRVRWEGEALVLLRRPGLGTTFLLQWAVGWVWLIGFVASRQPAANGANPTVAGWLAAGATAAGGLVALWRVRAFEELRLGPDGLTHRWRDLTWTRRRTADPADLGEPSLDAEMRGGNGRNPRGGRRFPQVVLPVAGDPDRPVRFGQVWPLGGGRQYSRKLLTWQSAALAGEPVEDPAPADPAERAEPVDPHAPSPAEPKNWHRAPDDPVGALRLVNAARPTAGSRATAAAFVAAGAGAIAASIHGIATVLRGGPGWWVPLIIMTFPLVALPAALAVAGAFAFLREAFRPPTIRLSAERFEAPGAAFDLPPDLAPRAEVRFTPRPSGRPPTGEHYAVAFTGPDGAPLARMDDLSEPAARWIAATLARHLHEASDGASAPRARDA